jgi:peptidoglycan/xylan/chitin deacetylase (PgdA/CDA1 family)
MKILNLASRFAPALLCFESPEERRNRVALTFDDGPHPEHTPRILDVLRDAGVRATFFFQGSNAAQWPALVRRAHAEGHQIAAHGIDHVAASKQSGAAATDNAVQCHALLCEISGTHLPRYYRPPYGDITFHALRALGRRGYRLAFWNYDSNDSHVTSASEIEKRVAATAPNAGSIVLLHDDYAHTVAALPQVIDTLRDRGLSFVTVAELCDA